MEARAGRNTWTQSVGMWEQGMCACSVTDPVCFSGKWVFPPVTQWWQWQIICERHTRACSAPAALAASTSSTAGGGFRWGVCLLSTRAEPQGRQLLRACFSRKVAEGMSNMKLLVEPPILLNERKHVFHLFPRAVLGIEPRASCVPVRCSYHWALPLFKGFQ